jgi:hypothetical protein
VRQWNLSYTCLTSFEARDRLRDMRTTDPEFWKELTQNPSHSDAQELPGLNEQLAEDIEPESDKSNTTLEDDDADDSDLPISTLINLMIEGDTNLPATVGTRRDGTLTSLADAENVDLEGDRVEEGSGDSESALEGKGKRKRRANQLYASFWRHYDEDSYWVDHDKE